MKIDIKNKENIKIILKLIENSDERILISCLKYEVTLIKILFDANQLYLYRTDDICGDLRLITSIRLSVIKSFIREKLNK